MEKQALTKEEIEKLAARGFRDPVFFFRTFLTKWFPKEMPYVHVGIIAIILRKTGFLKGHPQLDKIVRNFTYKADPTDPQSAELPIFSVDEDGNVSMRITQFTLIIMPRGFSKTTLLNGCVIYEIVYMLKRFPFYISESGPHAEGQLGNVKRELETNAALIEVFGNVVPGKQDRQKWTADEIETLTGVFAMARGRGGQVRGTNRDAARPDHILVDDVEDEESVSTEDQRAKTRKWFYEGVTPAINELDADATITALGTLLDKEALLQYLRRDPLWTTIVFGATDKDGEYWWPEKLDAAKDEAKKKSFAQAGNLSGYLREYHSQLKDEKTAKFKQSYIKHIAVPYDQIVVKALACDPASPGKGETGRNKKDYFAMACVGMLQTGQIVVLDADGYKGLTMREQVDLYFEWHARFGLTAADKHGIESNAYQIALVHLVREEMFRKKTYFEVLPVHHATNKLIRVEGILQPRYSSGYMVHAKPMPLLEQQLLDWPNDKLDVPDAVAQAVSLLDEFAMNATPDEHDLARDEYPPLDRVIGGEWRSAP